MMRDTVVVGEGGGIRELVGSQEIKWIKIKELKELYGIEVNPRTISRNCDRMSWNL